MIINVNFLAFEFNKKQMINVLDTRNPTYHCNGYIKPQWRELESKLHVIRYFEYILSGRFGYIKYAR